MLDDVPEHAHGSAIRRVPAAVLGVPFQVVHVHVAVVVAADETRQLFNAEQSKPPGPDDPR